MEWESDGETDRTAGEAEPHSHSVGEKPMVMNVNTMSRDQLVALEGMTSEIADAIVQRRAA